LEQDTTRVETSVGSLASIVAADGPLGFTEVLGLGADVADSLADRHAGGEAHGSVHPRAVVRGGDGPWVLAAPGLAAGTKAALAPELAEGAPPTPAADVFALGATLVFALTGQEFVDGALGASEPTPDETPADAGAAAASTGPLSLPDVMASFLDTLRRSLANDPATRGSAAKLAGTLRQLRSDAERAMAPPVVVDDLATRQPGAGAAAAAAGVSTVALTAGTAAAAGRAIAAEGGTPPTTVGPVAGAGAPTAPGVITVDGTTTSTEPAKKSFKQRFPALLAAAAIIVALVLGAALVRKDDKPAADLTATGPTTSTTATGPTTSLVPQTVIVVVTEAPTSSSSSSTSTTKPPTTTAPPPVTAPPSVAPPPVAQPPAGTVGVMVDMSQLISCGACPAPVRAQPSKVAQILFSAPDKTVLWAQCNIKGEAITIDQNTNDRWVYVVGPLTPGYISLVFLGNAMPAGLPECPPTSSTSTTSTTKAN